MSENNARKHIIRAEICTQNKLLLEAQDSYEAAIAEYQKIFQVTQHHSKRNQIQKIIEGYQMKLEELIDEFDNITQTTEFIHSIKIEHNSIGHDYSQIFGDYLNQATHEILIVDPYIHKDHQFRNLIHFLELAHSKCSNLSYVRLITKLSSQNTEQQKSNMDELLKNLENFGLRMSVKYGARHDRKIILSNGYIINIQRGLDIFQRQQPTYGLGLTDYSYRKCWETEVIVLRTLNQWHRSNCCELQ